MLSLAASAAGPQTDREGVADDISRCLAPVQVCRGGGGARLPAGNAGGKKEYDKRVSMPSQAYKNARFN